MSFEGDSGDITFNIYYNVKFKTDDVRRVSYEGGERHILEAPVIELFNCIGRDLKLSLYEQRIWYKLPYVDLSDLKFLCDGGDSFERLGNSATWTRCVEVYMEHKAVESDAVEVDAVENEAERDKEAKRDKEAETNVCEEDARVDEIVSAFVVDEEEENYRYRDTPPQSDDEEEETYERWRRGSGELKIKLVFESVKEFREAVIEYALLGGWNIRFNRWGYIKSEAVCGVQKGDNPCPTSFKFLIVVNIEYAVIREIVTKF